MEKITLSKNRRLVHLPDPRRIEIHAQEIAYRKRIARRGVSNRLHHAWHSLLHRRKPSATAPEIDPVTTRPRFARTAEELLKIQADLLHLLPVEIVTLIVDHILANQTLIHSLDLQGKLSKIREGIEENREKKLNPIERARSYWMDGARVTTNVTVPSMSLPFLSASLGKPILSTWAAAFYSDPGTLEFEFQGHSYHGPRIGPCINSLAIHVEAIFSPEDEHPTSSSEDPLRTGDGFIEFDMKFPTLGKNHHLIRKAKAMLDPLNSNELSIPRNANALRPRMTTATAAHSQNTPEDALTLGPDWEAEEPLCCWWIDNARGVLRASRIVNRHDQILGPMLALAREGDWFQMSLQVNHPRLIEITRCEVQFLTTYRSLLQHMPNTWLARTKASL